MEDAVEAPGAGAPEEKQLKMMKAMSARIRQGDPLLEPKKIRLQPRMMVARESYIRTEPRWVPQKMRGAGRRVS